MSETWEEYGPGQGKSKASKTVEQPQPPEQPNGTKAAVEGPEIPVCPQCDMEMEEVHQMNERGTLGWGYAGHASNRLYLMGMIRESGMSVKTARLRAFCCPKCRRGEFRY